MILKTNTHQAVSLEEKGITTFMFEEGKQARDFIRSIDLLIKKKKEMNEHAFYLMDDEFQDLNYKNLYPVMMDCGKLDLADDKSFKDNTISMFENMVFEHEEVNEIFHQLQVSIDNLVNKLEVAKTHYTIEFQSETFDVKKMLKLLKYDIHRNGSALNHLELRECFFDIMKQMNVDKKEIIFFIIYPENHMGVKEIEKFMKWLKKLNVTIIILTNDYRVIKNTKYNYVNLVKHNKDIYNIIDLSNELRLFLDIDESVIETLSLQLSYFDFTETELMISDKYSKFINSSKL